MGQRRRKVAWMPASAGMTTQTATGETNVGALEVKRPPVKPGAKYKVTHRTIRNLLGSGE